MASLFGMAHWLVTMAWSRHEDFGWPALVSLGVVGGSAVVHGVWLVRGSLGVGEGL